MMKTVEILEKLKKDNKYIKYVRKELKANKDFAYLILAITPTFYKYLSDDLKRDKDILNFIIKTYDFNEIENIELVIEEDKLKTDLELLEIIKELRYKSFIYLMTYYWQILNFDLNLINQLKEIEKIVIIERYGLEDGIIKTPDQVGLILGLNKGKVRQIESKAFNRISNIAYKNSVQESISENGTDLSSSIKSLNLSVRAYKYLKNMGIVLIKDLTDLTTTQLKEKLTLNYFNEVQRQLHNLGYNFKDEENQKQLIIKKI